MTAAVADVANNPREEIRQRMEALVRGGAGIVLELYFQEELSKRQQELLSCTKETFEVHKGRCIELQQIVKNIESMRVHKP